MLCMHMAPGGTGTHVEVRRAPSQRPVMVEEVNKLFEEASKTYLRDILGYETRPLVSTDFVNDPRSSIVDALSTMVVDGTHVKVYAWYDNEFGYANRMLDICRMVAKSLA